MKKSMIISLLVLTAVVSCEKLPIGRIFRSEVFPSGGSSAGQEKDAPAPDTSILLSAVLVPQQYDWRRDTAYGYPTCELILLKNGSRTLSMHTGPAAEVSPNPSTHHLLNSHLYTEYSSAGGTVIREDGVEKFRYPEAEVLVGLLPSGNDIYTLGMERDGDGFCFRKNGNMLFRQASGSVFGAFTHSAYGRTGALYEDNGVCCFCFKNGTDCYMVIDGVPERVTAIKNASRVLDMRVYDSELYYVSSMAIYTAVNSPTKDYALPASYIWKSVELLPIEGRMWYIGSAYRNGDWFTVCAPLNANSQSDEFHVFEGLDAFIYHDGSAFYSVDISGGGVRVMDPGESISYGRDSTFFFSYSCAYMAGNSLFMALTPKEKELPPLICCDGEERPFDLQGYFTGMEVEISQSN